MSFKNLTIGKNSPNTINVVVEIPKGSHTKYEYDEELDMIKLDRILHSSVYYPTDYGFIPQTRSGDGDHLDALILVTDPLFPGCVVSVRPVGVLYMVDQNEKDEKIVAVAEKDPLLSQIHNIEDIDEFLKKIIHNFFETYKQLENKKVTVHEWRGRDFAHEIILKAQEKFSKEQK